MSNAVPSTAELETLLRSPHSEAHKEYLAKVSGAQLFSALYEMYLTNLAWFNENLKHPAPVEKEKTEPQTFAAAVQMEFDNNSKNKTANNLGSLLANYALAVSNLISLLVQFAQIQEEIVRTHAAAEALIENHFAEWEKAATESSELLLEARERGELHDLSDAEIAFLAGVGTHPTADDLVASDNAHARDGIFALWNDLERDNHTHVHSRNADFMTDLRYRVAHICHGKGETNIEKAREVVISVSKCLTKKEILLNTIMQNYAGLVTQQAKNFEALLEVATEIHKASHNVRARHSDLQQSDSSFVHPMPEILDFTKNVQQAREQHSIRRGLASHLNMSILRPGYSTRNHNADQRHWWECNASSSHHPMPNPLGKSH